jgi:hypothetical protein
MEVSPHARKGGCLLASSSTMHPFPLVIFLTLAAGPNRPIPAGCREDHGTCREDCTIEYGGSTTKYRQLTACLVSCDKEQKECTSRHYSLLDMQSDSVPPPRTEDPAMRESDTVPASGTEPAGDSVRRGVYRASEAESPAPAEPPAPVEPPAPPVKEEPIAAPAPAPKPEPKAQPAAQPKPVSEPVSKDSEDVPIFDEPEPAPAPKPAPKPVEPMRPQPPPEPKKKDISEWDPNGD